MSFFFKTTALVRTAVPRSTTRLFSTTLQKQNVIKDAAKKVDRVVSDQIVKGIDTSVELKEGAQAAFSAKSEKAKEQADKVSGQVQGMAAELKGEIKAKVEEVKDKLS
ncbi:hypothetical protein DV736_g6019, partial [Chaetothyriales sp. CBS 134916]